MDIFDKINKASTIKEYNFYISELVEKIEHTKNKCGSCKLWMTQECPNETKTNKVSCDDRKCSSFDMQDWHTSFIAELELDIERSKLKIEQLEKELKLL